MQTLEKYYIMVILIDITEEVSFKMPKIPLTVIHYHKHDPLKTKGGVQTFALNLKLIFKEVQFMTPKDCDFKYAMKHHIPVISENQGVVDWPKKYAVVGFQHGVGAVKFNVTQSKVHRRMASAQKRAAKRKNTIWVACAEWISTTFGQLHNTATEHIIYHAVDIDKFDGKLENHGSRLILHDARTMHKGKALIEKIKKAFPEWKFELLGCSHNQVPDRMRGARAFIHLSRYEGNSIVCNEAIAMNLPCLFTAVGLMKDQNHPTDVYIVDPDDIYDNPQILVKEVGTFFNSLNTRKYNPRDWILANATPEINVKKWYQVMTHYQKLSGWDLDIPQKN